MKLEEMLMNELDTIRRCLAGDQNGYAELYNDYAGGLYRLCYGLLLHRQDAEDVLQETFVYAFKSLKRYDAQRASFKTWLYTIAVSRCRNMHRRKQFQIFDINQVFDLASPFEEQPESQFAQQNARHVVERALRELSPILREAVVLRYAHGLTYREMAEMLDCPQKTAESRVRLAHEKLRTLLQPNLLEELLVLGHENL
jgi:RNA polymerase sigma-70 factor, ECF subfamily